MSVPIFVADAFTLKAFTGNPAGVCVLPAPREVEWMQSVAREMKHSETAFVVPQGDSFSLRWFTPEVEVSLCGHATLATAHILWAQGFAPRGHDIRFSTASGVLTAHQSGDWIELDFPAHPERACAAPAGLDSALHAKLLYVGLSESHTLVLLNSERTVRELRPDFVKLRDVDVRAVVVTAPAETLGYDFVSRMFAPRLGIDEDPVTGSAHCCLAPYWQSRLHKSEFMALQVSERGGVLRVRISGDRVILGGQAVTVVKGELAV